MKRLEILPAIVLIAAALAAGAVGGGPARAQSPAPGAAPAEPAPPPYFILRVVERNVTIRVMRPVVEPRTPVFSGPLAGSRDVGDDGIATIRVRGTGRIGIGLNVIEIGEEAVRVNGAPLLESAVTLNLDGTVSPATRP